jgi:hypothetical protein
MSEIQNIQGNGAMSKTILIVTDNLPDQINGWLPLTKISRRMRFATTIVLYILIPGGSATLIALATTKSRLPFPGMWARYLRRSVRIISTSPPRSCGSACLDNILTNIIIATTLLIILSFQKDLENCLAYLKHYLASSALVSQALGQGVDHNRHHGTRATRARL